MRRILWTVFFASLILCVIAGSVWAQIQPPQATYSGTLRSTVDPVSGDVSLTFLNAYVTSVQYSDGTVFTPFTQPADETIMFVPPVPPPPNDVRVLLQNATIAAADCIVGAASLTTQPGAQLEVSAPGPNPPSNTYFISDFVVGGDVAMPGMKIYNVGSGWALHPTGVNLDPNDMTTLNYVVGATATTATNPSRFIDEFESALHADRLAGSTMIITGGADLCEGGDFNINGVIDGVFTPKFCEIEVTKTVDKPIVQCPCDNEVPTGDSDSDSDGDGDTDSGDGDNDSDSDSDPLNGGNCSCEGVFKDFSDSDSDSDGDGDTDSGDCDNDSDSDSHYDSDDSDSEHYSYHYGYKNDSGTVYDSDSDSQGICNYVCPVNQVVTYTYVITNNGADLVNVSAHDNKLGQVAYFPSFPEGSSETVELTYCVTDDVTNTVQVKGFLASSCTNGECADQCMDEASVTVNIEYVMGDHTYADSDSDSDSEMQGDSGDSSYWWWQGLNWWTR